MSRPVEITDPYSLENRTFTIDYAIEINSEMIYDSSYKAQVKVAWIKAARLQYAQVLADVQAYIGAV